MRSWAQPEAAQTLPACPWWPAARNEAWCPRWHFAARLPNIRLMPFGPGVHPSSAQSCTVTALLCHITEDCSSTSIGELRECGGLSAVGEEGTGRAPRTGGVGLGRLFRQVAMPEMRVIVAALQIDTPQPDRVPNCR